MLADKARAAAVSQEPVYVEDVFSTWLYTGTGATQTITNGVDLAGEGGLVWIKQRSGSQDHTLFDTARGVNNYLRSNTTGAQNSGGTYTDLLTAFNASGFSLGADASTAGFVNGSGSSYVSWTFRKQPKFFDVVTYTGNGSNRTIAHNLGSVPGCIIVKRTDTTADWAIYHRSLANTEYLVLNTTAASVTNATWWNSTTPTSTVFSLGTAVNVNASGGTYVAYLFAHDAGGFGLSGTENVISCGSFTTDAGGNASVTLGYEPQLVLVKNSSTTGSWNLYDIMRGADVSGSTGAIYPNFSSAEGGGGEYQLGINATGFTIGPGTAAAFTAVYIAIRRGPMEVPTSASQVFNVFTYTGTGTRTFTETELGFTADAVWPLELQSFGDTRGSSDRLRGNAVAVRFPSANAEDANGAYFTFSMGVYLGPFGAYDTNTYATPFFRRAPGFFDIVCDTGTGLARTVTHNLAAIPELMIRKKRNASGSWVVYANNDNTDYLELNTTAATLDDNTVWNDTSPTASVFTVGTNSVVNGNTATFVTYLFATLPGVSKVGSYTGTGTTLQINCGFAAGTRFVLIKRVDSTGNWYVWDSARGIVAGNDPYLLLNSTAAQVTSTDYVDTYSLGFEISSTAPAEINANGGTFIFLAIA